MSGDQLRECARSGLLVTVMTTSLLGLSGFTASNSVAATIVHAPRLGAVTTALGWSSSNWSGYAKTGHGFTAVTGKWVVPTVTPTAANRFSSSWIGIDGFSNSQLIQTGTEQDSIGGAAFYGAWWEILPAPATFVRLAIHPGDHMSASIAKGVPTWTITIADTTTGHAVTVHRAYPGHGASVEWIQEAPTVNGSQAHLAVYGHTTFDPGTANGANPHLTGVNGGFMAQFGAKVSTPSNPDADTDGFNIAYGPAQPAPPPT
jgi:hypothetical protein